VFQSFNSFSLLKSLLNNNNTSFSALSRIVLRNAKQTIVMMSSDFNFVNYSSCSGFFCYATPGDDDFFPPLLPPRDPLDPLLGGAVPAAASICAASTLLFAERAVASFVEGSAALVVVVVDDDDVVLGYTAFGSATLLMPVNRRCKRLRSRDVI